MNFLVGDKVFYLYLVRGGWGYTYRIPATIVKINAKTIKIRVQKNTGEYVERNVKRDNLSKL